MIDYAAVFTNFTGAFPDIVADNVSAPGAGDGTEFIKAMVDDIWGRAQAIMNYAGLTPDGVAEADGTAQVLEALKKGFAVGPGIGVTYWKEGTPAANGDRVLLLQGQVVLIALYADLTAACYVGNANNATASAFYKTSDAGGVTRDTAGTYLVLPDTRGYALRGYDAAAAVDPDGASRDLGNVQVDAMQKITGHAEAAQWISNAGFTATGALVQGVSASVTIGGNGGGAITNSALDFDNSASVAPNTAKTDDVETRMSNIATNFGITY